LAPRQDIRSNITDQLPLARRTIPGVLFPIMQGDKFELFFRIQCEWGHAVENTAAQLPKELGADALGNVEPEAWGRMRCAACGGAASTSDG